MHSDDETWTQNFLSAYMQTNFATNDHYYLSLSLGILYFVPEHKLIFHHAQVFPGPLWPS